MTIDLAELDRVSTVGQAKDGFGLDVQRAMVKAWAKATAGVRVTLHFADEGVGSGNDDLDARLALAEALQAVRDGIVSGLVVPRLDRLARDTVLQEMLIRDIRKMGGQVFSTIPSEQDNLTNDDSDPGRKMVRVIMSAVAEYEKSMITLRMKSGRELARSHGKYAGDGPAFGLRSVKADGRGKILAPDPREAGTAARIREMRADGMSTPAIANVLNMEKITTKRGASWTPMAVWRVAGR